MTPREMRMKERLVTVAGGFSLLFSSVAAKLVLASYIDPFSPTDPGPGVHNPYASEILILSELFVVSFTVFCADRLFALRCRNLLTYGSAEICVGISASIIAINQLYGAKFQGAASAAFSEAAALYVCVRGLDNIQRALPEGRTKQIWNLHYFGNIEGASGRSHDRGRPSGRAL
jgi:hypothetical protein